MVTFTGEISSAGQGGHAVVVPKEVAATFSTKRAPVLALINGVEYHSRLMVYGGRCFLGLRKELLRQAGVAAGDQVSIELTELEPAEHEAAVAVEAPELTAALAEDEAAGAAYAALPFSHQQEYARWVAEAAKPQTKQDRVRRTISRLRER